jgi:chaperonin GroES
LKPGEYKVVNAPGGDLRNAIVERTIPHPSAVLFSLLELLLGAAKEISSVKDVITGDTPATAPVGTTLALIEQGLTVFTSIYKRVYRSLKEEFKLIYECERRWNPNAQQEYAELFDDPEADFEADFSDKGLDIAPVSDPSVVTKMQSMARAQFLMGLMEQGAPLNPQETMKRVLEAADIPDADKLIVQPQPDPTVEAENAETVANTALKEAQTVKTMAEAGHVIGETEATNDFERGLGSVAGEPGDAMGAGGLPEGGGGAEAGLDEPLMGDGAGQPPAADGTQDAL